MGYLFVLLNNFVLNALSYFLGVIWRRIAVRQTLLRCVYGGALAVGLTGVLFFLALVFRTEQSNTAARSNLPPDKKAPQELLLPEEERSFLWDCEHHGNLLRKHGFAQLETAIQKTDGAAILKALAADFTGKALFNPQEITRDSGSLRVVRQEETGQFQNLSRDQFVEKLLAYRRLFHQTPKVSTALMTLSPTTRNDPNGSWDGNCVLRLFGEVRPGQPAEVVLKLDCRTVQPIEENLAKNGWLRNCTISQTLTGQSDRWLFQEVAARRGIEVDRLNDAWKTNHGHASSGGVFVCDFNRDGILDLFLTDITGLYLYAGTADGKFQRDTRSFSSAHTVSTGEHLVAAFADLDGDGWDDLIWGNRIFRNDKGVFRGVGFLSKSMLPEIMVGMAIADYDRDGLLDIYIAGAGKMQTDSWMEGKSGTATSNVLLRNKGNFRFENVTAAAGVGGDRRSTFTALWLDLNNDGWPDLYVPNEFGKGAFFINNGDGKTFREQEIDGPGDFGTMGAACGDFDNDGFIDLYAANMYSKAGSRVFSNMNQCRHPYDPDQLHTIRQFVAGSQLYRNLGDHRMDPLGKKFQVNAVGWAYGPALADLDNDGFLDIYATAGFISRSRTEPDG